jgi:SARP family transcriptional regulator, regulator of embCAB operon
MFEVQVLGPLVIRYRARILTLQPMQAVMFLALWCTGTALTPLGVAELVWDDLDMVSVKTVHSHVRRIRGAVSQAGGAAVDLIVTTMLGGSRSAYVLADGLDVDADRFTTLVSSGLESYRHGRYEQADGQFAFAQKLWRDEPMKDAAQRPFTLQRTNRLQETKRSATFTQQKAAICLGRHREAVAELYPLTQEHPGEVEGWMALAIALTRSGRVTEACDACYQALRLFQGKGLMGPALHRLQDLQRDILSGTLPMSGALGF